jgi:hypothetical protein
MFVRFFFFSVRRYQTYASSFGCLIDSQCIGCCESHAVGIGVVPAREAQFCSLGSGSHPEGYACDDEQSRRHDCPLWFDGFAWSGFVGQGSDDKMLSIPCGFFQKHNRCFLLLFAYAFASRTLLLWLMVITRFSRRSNRFQWNRVFTRRPARCWLSCLITKPIVYARLSFPFQFQVEDVLPFVIAHRDLCVWLFTEHPCSPRVEPSFLCRFLQGNTPIAARFRSQSLPRFSCCMSGH